VSERFDGDWLALREPFDKAARSQALARRLAASLPARPRIVDLGAGTGSLFRWLAPIIGGAQDWVFVDADATLLRRGLLETAAWAQAHGLETALRGDSLRVSTKQGAWQVQTMQADLRAVPESGMPAQADAIVCSALLDLVSSDWIERLAAALRVPLLACLSADGRDAWWPLHAADRRVAFLFRRDQGRDKGFGPALGPLAPRVLCSTLRAHGFGVATQATDWRISGRVTPMLHAMISGHADVAERRDPTRRHVIAGWRKARLLQAASARLAIRIGHRDILALPGAASRARD
jgi:hypothetical protein